MKFTNRLIPVFLISLFLIVLFGFYRNHALSFHFVDEEDNIVLGNYLLQGEKLYRDLFSHHQPLAYILSAVVQKISTPPNMFLLIERHREAVLFWAIAWTILLVARFGWPLFFFALLFEPIKSFLLGQLFLAESFVVYPLAYLVSFIFQKSNAIKFEYFFLGICLSLVFFLLSPLWPAAFMLLIIILSKIYKERRNLILFILGNLLIVAIILPFLTIGDYLFNAFLINFKYYIPLTKQGFTLTGFLQSFFAPFISLTLWTGRSATLQIIQLLSVFLIFNMALLLGAGKIGMVVLIFTLLGLINLRFVTPGIQEYNGFHILPWFTALILVCALSSLWVIKKYPQFPVKFIIGTFFLFIVFIEFLEVRQTLFVMRDANKDFFINYSRQEDFGRAIGIMKKGDEKLFVVPDEWLIYWQADIGHYSKMVNYYAWMSDVPGIKDPLMQKFVTNPPAYFYCDKCERGYFGLEEFFGNYKKLKKDGKETNLMVRKEKLKTLSNEQIKELNYYNFAI